MLVVSCTAPYPAGAPNWLERGLQFSQSLCGGEANLKFFAVGATNAFHFKKSAFPLLPRFSHVALQYDAVFEN